MCCSVLRYVAVFTVFSFLFWYVAVCGGVLQCVAVCCSVLQRVASCATPICMSAALEGYVAVCCSVLWCIAVRCSVFQCVAVCCGVLQCVAVCCSVFLPARRQSACRPLCNIIQQTATHCITLQHTATLPAKRQSPCRLVWLSSTQNNYCSAGTGKIITSQLYSHFTWCILSQDDFWEYLPVAAATWRRSIRLRRPGVSKETYIHQKRRIYIKRKVYKSKEAYINQKRRT